MAIKRFACMLLARAARSTKPRLGAVAVISSTVCSKPASTKACLISRASWRLKAYSGIPRALIAPGTPTVWPTSTTTRNEARAQLSEAAWLGFWMRCWARSPSAPAASRVIAIITPRYFVAARTPIIRLTSYRSGRKFPLPSSEIGYEGLILFAPWCRCGGRSAPQGVRGSGTHSLNFQKTIRERFPPVDAEHAVELDADEPALRH